MSKYSKLEEMMALLEMIGPTEEELAKNRNAGGMVSYRTAKEFYDFVKDYIDKLEEALHSAECYQDYDDMNGQSRYKASEAFNTLKDFIKENNL